MEQILCFLTAEQKSNFSWGNFSSSVLKILMREAKYYLHVSQKLKYVAYIPPIVVYKKYRTVRNHKPRGKHAGKHTLYCFLQGKYETILLGSIRIALSLVSQRLWYKVQNVVMSWIFIWYLARIQRCKSEENNRNNWEMRARMFPFIWKRTRPVFPPYKWRIWGGNF